jgi:rhodanese-related sulfurtransferase
MLKNHILISIITFTLAMLSAQGIFAESQDASPPPAASVNEGFTSFHRIVDADFVAQSITSKPQNVAIIDSRPIRKFKQGHIDSAINIPESSFEEMKGRLPSDKASLLIFYCGGLKCPLSHKSAFAAEKLGYTNIAVYAAGYPDWVAHQNAQKTTK